MKGKALLRGQQGKKKLVDRYVQTIGSAQEFVQLRMMKQVINSTTCVDYSGPWY